jgi:UDP-glucose:(heptosyl)LPS alpha-1,3-glucosyltransferase
MMKSNIEDFAEHGIVCGSEMTRPKLALCYSGCHRRGGVERVVFEVARHLHHNWRTSVIAHELPLPGELHPDVEMVPLAGKILPFGLGIRRTRSKTQQVVDVGDYDVVAGFGVQAPRESVVWIQSVHAAWWDLCRRRRRGSLRWQQGLNPFHHIVLKMEDELLRNRRYRRLIALSPAVRDDLSRFYGVPASDVDILPNGFHPEEFHPGVRVRHRLEQRRRFGIPLGAWVVLFVANEWERKGLVPLLDAVAKMKDPSIHLVAAGRLPAGRIMHRAASLGIQERVHLVGQTGHVNECFGMADAFALPTIYEAWGMVIIEALACGLPVLTSQTAGAAEAVQAGVNGYLLSHPEQVEAIAEGLIKLRNGMYAAPGTIAQTVAPYAWERLMREYSAILRRNIS